MGARVRKGLRMRWLLLVGVVSAWDVQPQCDPTANPMGPLAWGAATYCNPASISDGVRFMQLTPT
jgi:hypothetical protein